jgi:hypothetical protein
MSWLGAALRELFALFVDDVGFSAALLAWVLLATLLLPRLGLARGWGGPLLFAGCAAALLVSARRAARR